MSEERKAQSNGKQKEGLALSFACVRERLHTRVGACRRNEMKRFLDQAKDTIVRVLQEHGVVHAGVFGSVAREESQEESDLDLVIEFQGDKTLLDLVAVKLDLEDVLGRRVDVLTYSALHPLLRQRVVKEQVVIL